MPRGLVTLFVALEALFVVGIGIGIALVPLLVGWASVNHFQATPLDVWQLAVQVWALGHGVPLHVDLTGVDSLFPAEMSQFDITLSLMGCALITLLLAVRAGRRIADTEESPLVGAMLVAFVAVLVGLALLSGQSAVVNVEVLVGTVKILIPFLIGLVYGWKPWRLLGDRNPLAKFVSPNWMDVVVTAGRITAGAFLGLVVLASITLAWGIASGFSTEIGLYEALHGGFVGGLVMTAAQLLALPTIIVWTMGWLIGPGFSLGLGTLVTPLSATVGAFPAIPMLGAIPSDGSVVGWPVLLVPFLVVVAVAAQLSWGIVVRAGYFDSTGSTDYIRAAVLALTTALLSTILMFVVGAFASGAAGPGRFVFVGVDPGDVALAWGGFVLVGTLVGAAARLIRPLPADVAQSVHYRTR
ncbi:MAG: hypothetical protein RLZZ40_791 [Actinomycetota bacterium]